LSSLEYILVGLIILFLPFTVPLIKELNYFSCSKAKEDGAFDSGLQGFCPKNLLFLS